MDNYRVIKDLKQAMDDFESRVGNRPAATVVPRWMWEELEKCQPDWFIRLRDEGSIVPVRDF